MALSPNRTIRMTFTTLSLTLLVHIAAGALALLAGLVAIVTTKGGSNHLRAGTVYALSMAVVVVTAVPLALVDENYFLFTIAVFSGYLVAAGYRALARKRPEPRVAAPVDWTLHLTMVVFGVGMLVLGVYKFLSGDSLGAVLLVFGGIGLALAVQALWRIYRPPAERMAWLDRHITLMGGGYIATVTAAVTVNLTMVPPLARWLGPTAVGVPAILLAITRRQRRFADGPSKAGAD
ncbi:MAG: putative membrane protein [Natronomonas sp.]|jgi:uncharacterized membrane protein